MSTRARKSSFVRQAAILAAASLFVRFIGFLYRIPLTDLIGDIGMAYYAAAYGIYTLAIALSSGALPAAVSKLISERISRGRYRDAHRMFKTALAFAAVSGAIVAFVMGFGANFWIGLLRHEDAVFATRTLAPALFFVAVLAVFRGYFQGMKTALPTAVSQTIEQLFKIAFSLFLAYIFFDAADIQPSVAGATVGSTIAAVAGLIVIMLLYALVSKDLRLRARNDRRRRYESPSRQLSAIMQTALPMTIGMSIFAVSGIIDMRMAASRMDAAGVFTLDEIRALTGQFTGKFILLTTLPISLSVALSAAVIPEITSANVNKDTNSVRHKTNTALRLSMILSIPAAVGMAVLANPIIALIFPRMPEGGRLLQVGAASIVFISLVHVLTGSLQGLGHVKLPVIAAFFGVLTKIPVNYFLIAMPQVNILGAVISTIVCYIVAAIFNIYFLYKKAAILPSIGGAFIKPLVASALMGMLCFVVYHTLEVYVPAAIATIISLAMGGVAYVLFMCILRGFRKSDLQSFPVPKKVKLWLQNL